MGPRVDAMYGACAEVLAAACRIGTGPGSPATDVVRQEMLGLMRQYVSRCRELGIPDNETAEGRYALVAFIDDRVLKSNWPGRAEWMSNPLQLQFFREYTAGENFFARMRALSSRGGPFWALEVYYLCLALGFVGALQAAGGPQGVRGYLESARPTLVAGQNGSRFAPNAVPAEHHRVEVRAFPVAVALALAAIFLCVVGFVAVNWSLASKIGRTGADLSAATPSFSNTLGGER